MNAYTDERRGPATLPALPHPPEESAATGLLLPLLGLAVSATLVAIENHAELVPLLGSTPEKIRRVQQATQATQDLQTLTHWAEHHDAWISTEITSAPWPLVREHFSRAVRKQDLCACLIIQDLMTATLARVLYQSLARQDDQPTRILGERLSQGHDAQWMAGINPLQALLAVNPDLAHDSLVWAHQRVMNPWVATLQNDTALPHPRRGAATNAATWQAERARLGNEARQAYADALDAVGYDPRVTKPLIASLSHHLRNH